MSDRAALLAKITNRINKEAQKENPSGPPVAFVAAGNEDLLDFGLIPTGNPAIDEALGGGFPRGTIVQVAGQEGTGKTCMAFDMIAYNQRMAREKGEEFWAAYVHLESSAFPFAPAINAGVDLDQLIIINALSSGEKTFNIMMKYLWDWDKRSAVNALDMVVVDSIAAASPEAEMESAEKDLANVTIGRQAAMMSKVLRIISGSGALGRSLLLLINQDRTGIETWGATKVRTGGKAMGYYPKITVGVSKPTKGKLTRGSGAAQETYGHTVAGVVEKNNTQVGKPYASFVYPVIYGEGVDLICPAIDIAVRKGVIEQTSSAWFQLQYMGDLVRFNGKDKIYEKARADKEFFDYIVRMIVNQASHEADVKAPLKDEQVAELMLGGDLESVEILDSMGSIEDFSDPTIPVEGLSLDVSDMESVPSW